MVANGPRAAAGRLSAQGAWFIAANSQTYDEAVNLCAGYAYLAAGDFGFNSEHPPLMKELAALPIWLCYQRPLPADPDNPKWDAQWLAGRRFLYQPAASGPSADCLLNLGRVPNLLLGTLLVGLVGLWSYRLWGRGGGLLAVALAAFDPNLVAHASLATNDLGLAFFAFLTLYLLWKYTGNRARSWGQLVAVGLALGLALASKFSAVSLVGILALVAVAEMLSGNPLKLPAAAGAPKNKRIWQRLAEAGAAPGILLGIAFLVFWSTYFFHSFGAAATVCGCSSITNRADTRRFCWGGVRTPAGGIISRSHCLLKTPLATLVLMIASFVLCRAGSPLGLRGFLYLAVPVVLVLAAATAARIDIGLRLRSSRLSVARMWPRPFGDRPPRADLDGPWLPGAWRRWADFFAAGSRPTNSRYFNELAGGPAGGLHYLGDSNLDWGQGLAG